MENRKNSFAGSERDGVILSIIIPVYNEEKTICFSLDSILLQSISYKYEIIIVDDCSSDNTIQLISGYLEHQNNITLIKNQKNIGKGGAVRKAYEISIGKYIHVLDGDDFFIKYNKLERQIKFLENNQDFFACCHNSIIFYRDGSIKFVNSQKQKKYLTYEESVTNGLYCHTSSFMFRKIGQSLPEYFIKKEMRGDTAFFFYHAFNSKGKLFFDPTISSLYNFHGSGLWSGLSSNQQNDLVISVLKAIDSHIVRDNSKFEHQVMLNHIDKASSAISKSVVNPGISLDDILFELEKLLANLYKPSYFSKVFKDLYIAERIDEICEIVGRLIIYNNKLSLRNRNYNKNKMSILVSGLVPNGGGVYREIIQLIEIYKKFGFDVKIYSSNKIPTDNKIFQALVEEFNINVWVFDASKTQLENLESLIFDLYESAPGKIFPFISHHDVFLNCAVQRGLGEKIILNFVYDHGLSLGLTNSSIDSVIVKNDIQYQMLSSILDNVEFVLIPPLIKRYFDYNNYKCRNINNLRTASASARSYKYGADYKYSYLEIVPQIIRMTGGIHFHYGPISEFDFKRLKDNMIRYGADIKKFIHVDWADNFQKSLVENDIQLFLNIFPIPSARIAIEVMACGIPLMYHRNSEVGIPDTSDFIDVSQFYWDHPNDIFKIIRRLDCKILCDKSDSAFKYVLEHNDFMNNMDKFISLTPVDFDYKTGDRSVSKVNDLFEIEFSASANVVINSVLNLKSPVSKSIAGTKNDVSFKNWIFSKFDFVLNIFFNFCK